MLAVTRAEIKLWEKSFRAANGRTPTVDDIKARPDIADKYRLYKRLLKEAPAVPAPSTPPKNATLLPSASRAAEATAPLATFNPFSPVKNKAEPTRNPFVTPTKSAAKHAPLDSPAEPSSSKQPAVPPSPTLPTSAVSRARKRLRGEPVSPSPNKEKRQRVDSYPRLPAPALHFSNLDDDPVYNHANKSGLTVIDASPVKQPENKSFTILFEESLPPLVLDSKKDNDTAPQARCLTSSESPLTEQPIDALPSFDKELGWLKNNHVLKGKKHHPRVHKTGMARKASKQASTATVVNDRDLSKPIKRSLSEMESDMPNTLTGESGSSHRHPSLIPPSPSEADSPFTRAPKPHASSKSTATSRKKTKISNPNASGDDSSEADDDLKPKIKVIDSTTARFRRGGRGDDDRDENIELDPDPLLAYTFRHTTPDLPRGSRSLRDEPSTLFYGAGLSNKVESDLPDKLRDVLALDTVDMKARDRHEERMVERLLYNRKTIHYDPDKGGEVWDVGEDGKSTRIGWDGEILHDTEGEDDWEGEPVPWEVAEL